MGPGSRSRGRRPGEAEIVAHHRPGDAALPELAQLLVRGRRDDDQRRKELLEDVAVVARHQAGELADVVGDPVNLDGALVVHADRLGRRLEPEEIARGEEEGSPQVDVAVGRGESVEVGAADGGEDRGGALACERGQLLAVEHGPDFVAGVGTHGWKPTPVTASRGRERASMSG